jgi:hypothetical protein
MSPGRAWPGFSIHRATIFGLAPAPIGLFYRLKKSRDRGQWRLAELGSWTPARAKPDFAIPRAIFGVNCRH